MACVSATLHADMHHVKHHLQDMIQTSNGLLHLTLQFWSLQLKQKPSTAHTPQSVTNGSVHLRYSA